MAVAPEPGVLAEVAGKAAIAQGEARGDMALEAGKVEEAEAEGCS